MINASDYTARVERCWSKRTASTFCDSNPALGQCSVTALVAQDFLGGEIAKTKVGGAWHFYNILDGKRFDFTAAQFERAIDYDDLVCSRADAFADTSLPQYEELSRSFANGS